MYNTDGRGRVWNRKTGEIVLEIPMKEFDEWIQALRGGKYKQTRETLQNQNGFCCLGVLCKTVIPKRKLVFNSYGHLRGGVPDIYTQPNVPLWVENINDVISSLNLHSLSALNDSFKLSFDEIADFLELTFKECAFNE